MVTPVHFLLEKGSKAESLDIFFRVFFLYSIVLLIIIIINLACYSAVFCLERHSTRITPASTHLSFSPDKIIHNYIMQCKGNLRNKTDQQ